MAMPARATWQWAPSGARRGGGAGGGRGRGAARFPEARGAEIEHGERGDRRVEQGPRAQGLVAVEVSALLVDARVGVEVRRQADASIGSRAHAAAPLPLLGERAVGVPALPKAVGLPREVRVAIAQNAGAAPAEPRAA